MRFHGPGEWYPQDQFVTAQNKGTVAKIFINRHISNIHEEQIGIFSGLQMTIFCVDDEAISRYLEIGR
jgi:hypothetical protein